MMLITRAGLTPIWLLALAEENKTLATGVKLGPVVSRRKAGEYSHTSLIGPDVLFEIRWLGRNPEVS